MNDKSGEQLKVWALLGPHRGDNNQVLALAEALGLPFEEKPLRFNRLRSLQPALLGATFASLTPRCRSLVEGPPPDLTISTGHRAVPVVRELKRRSGGKMRAVHLGYPRISPKHFDLVVPTPEYPVPDAANVIRIPFALSPLAGPRMDAAEAAAIESLPHPRRLFVVGGPTLYWELPVPQMIAALQRLIAIAEGKGGSVLAIGSPRTPGPLLEAVKRELSRATVPTLMAPREGSPSYRAMVAAADEIYVTADSVAMVADSVMTGKPVGIVPITKSAAGRAVMGLADRLRPGKRLHPRDLRFFWESLEEQGLGGTIEEPRAAEPPDLTADIAQRVRRLLGLSARPAKARRDSDR